MDNFICQNCGSIEDKYTKVLCKKCYNHLYYKEYYKNNKQKFLDGANKKYKDNKEECLKGMKKYYKEHKEEIKKYNKNYYHKNYDKMRKNGKVYYEENKKEINRRSRKRIMKRKETDINLRLKDKLGSRIRMAIKHHKGTKTTSSIILLGADIQTVRHHIENQFKEGMTWDNHGTVGWQIDHIKPCDSFDLTKEEEQKKCFHYTNLQPLWYFENIRKSNH